MATTAGDLTVNIPKLRTGSVFPSLLAPRRRIDVALHAVVMQAWVEGVSTRKVDDLVAALGVESGISKSEVSRICAELDAEVAVWRARPLDEQAFPYVFLEATYCKARVNGRVVSRAVVIATGVSADGRREVLGCDVGDSEAEVFWTEFLRDLRDRGLSGVQLVISDSHRGLTNAIATVMAGAAWVLPGALDLSGINLFFLRFAVDDLLCASTRTSGAGSPPGSRCCCRISTSGNSGWRWEQRPGCWGTAAWPRWRLRPGSARPRCVAV